MKIEVRLRAILEEHGLYRHGILAEMEDQIGLNRHTIRRLLNNNLPKSLEMLGDISDWLQKKGVPAEDLPQALLDKRPAELWKAAATPGKVTFYLGEYRETRRGAPLMRWVSLRDAAVQARIISHLSTPGEVGGSCPLLATEYVPFRFTMQHDRRKGQKTEGRGRRFEEDAESARRVFRAMRTRKPRGTSILIGSQRVNFLLEVFVANLFGCRAFPERGRSSVPFYLVYREGDRAVDSCFGGRKAPPGYKGKPVPGTYYLEKNRKWVCCPWEADKQDAGIVIVLHDPGSGALEIAAFGFSGRATEMVGRQLLRKDDPFWHGHAETKDKNVGVYVCKMALSKQDDDGGETALDASKCEIVPLDADMLRTQLE